MQLRWAPLVLGLIACSPSPRTIARVEGDASPHAGNPSSADDPLPRRAGARDRVRVVDAQLLSDMGSRLRGVLMPVDWGYQLERLDTVAEIGQSAGLNALHVYLENSSQETGAHLAQADALVSLTAAAGLYLVLGIGGGSMNGTFDIGKIRSFWALYGARYAEETHVIYEIQNNPELTCEEPVKPATIAMQQEIYELIRNVAPRAHVVFFSGSSLVRPPVLTDLVERLTAFADFSSSSIALHAGSDCTPLDELDSLSQAARAAGVPLFISQLPPADWPPYVEAFEQAGIGWMHHSYLTASATVASLIDATARAGLTWCPDFGTFPQNAGECVRP